MMTDNRSLTFLTPPVAVKQPQVLELHGDKRVDDYFWMRDREDEQVISYLEAENAYTDSIMKHTESLQTKLYEEMLGRIKETDLSVPYRKGDYYYYSRTEEGKAYSIFCRKKSSQNLQLSEIKLISSSPFHLHFRQ